MQRDNRVTFWLKDVSAILPSDKNQPLATLIALFHLLNSEGIRYCHWKSNNHLEQAVQGQTDLDLLVDPAHGQRFRTILSRANIKAMLSPPEARYPAIEDYLGIDADTGRLFHLHVHYQLILGEQYVKNYHLPLECAFWDHVSFYQKLIKIPAPELELSVLAIRALLKYRDRDAVKDVLKIRTPGMPANILNEFKYLLGHTDWIALQNILQEHCDFISPEIVLDLLRTIPTSPRAGLLFYRLRQQLRRDLHEFQRFSTREARRKYWQSILRQSLPFHYRAQYKKIPVTGGKIIAVVGADGAGKTTIVNELQRWLNWKLRVENTYMGSQQPSWLTKVCKFIDRGANKAWRIWKDLIGERNAPARWLEALQEASRNFYYLAISRDRYKRYCAARRQASQGTIVLCDRYPLEAIWRVMEQRPMDGPQIIPGDRTQGRRLAQYLSSCERKTYQKIRPPEHIIILHVSPEVSLKRKPEHDPSMIYAKAQALERIERNGLNITDIDADRDLALVLLQVKKAIWQLL